MPKWELRSGLKQPLAVLVVADSEGVLDPVRRELERLGHAARCTFASTADALSYVDGSRTWDLVICAGAGCWNLPSTLMEQAHEAPPLIYVTETYALAQAFPSNLYVETVDQELTGFGAAVRRALLFSAERRRRHERESAASQAQQLQTTVTVSLDEGVIVLDGTGRALLLNPAAERILGWESDEVSGLVVHDVIHGHETEGVGTTAECPLRQAHRAMRSIEVADDQFARRDGVLFPVSYRASPVDGDDGAPTFVIAFRDLSDRRRLEDELLQRTYRDPLTGLPNASLFREHLNQALLHSGARAHTIAVMFLDIDRFHVVNDGLGHTLGDQLLVEISQRVAASLPAGTVLARFGGDQFTVLIESVARTADAAAIAEVVIEELRAPFMLNGREIFITASAGIALSHSASPRPGDLLRDADAALHLAKASGRARLAVYDPRRHAPAVNRLDLETDLWRALQREEIEVHYQPTVDLATNAVSGCEALSRWRHTHLGLVSPASFIPLAEEMGLMISIGRWVLEESCRQARAWHTEFSSKPPINVSVNLSAKEFQHPDLARQVAGILRRTGVDPRTLTLEITESILMEDAPGTLKTLRALKKLGVRLAIDDFGTGYSSLSYLRRFPIDVVKIDQSLVKPLRNDRRSTAIVRAVTALAHDLGMTVTAEGIETPLQMACLRDVRADLGQGYLYSAAVDGESMTELIRAGSISPQT